jgi:hypothetical protein
MNIEHLARDFHGAVGEQKNGSCRRIFQSPSSEPFASEAFMRISQADACAIFYSIASPPITMLPPAQLPLK